MSDFWWPSLTLKQAKSAKDLVALMDAMMVSDHQEDDTRPRKQFKIKSSFGNLRIGFSEPAIWKTWRKSGRVNTDAEKFMVKKYNTVVQRMKAIGAQVVFPVELPSQASLTIDGKNCFESVVCKSSNSSAVLTHTRPQAHNPQTQSSKSASPNTSANIKPQKSTP
jgi:Asp-tRNA(Asn)/Glu-tRNA(Gln) amidotransferase A subunit family amidase